jgi:hypothetical protein
MNRVIYLIVFVNIFLSAYVAFKSPFEFYPGYIAYFFIPFFLFRIGIPAFSFIIFPALFVIGLIYVQLGLNSLDQLLKVCLGFMLSMSLFEIIVGRFRFNILDLFNFYVKSAFWVSLIGFIQVLSFRIGFGVGYNFGWLFNKWAVILAEDGTIRMNSLFSEPSYFASSIAPCFFIAVYNIINFRNPKFLTLTQSVVVITTYPFTQSGVAMFGIVLTIFLMMLNSGFIRFGFILGPILFFSIQYGYQNNAEFRRRFDSTFEIYNTGNIYSYDIHGSSFILYNHTHIATENFKENPLFGTGLGSHENAFNRFSLTNFEGVVDLEFNKSDANSMALRIMSETGLFGMIIFGLFIISNAVFKIGSIRDEYWLVSNACLLIILLQLLRQGNYFYCGFPFFIWVYYYTKKANQLDKKGLVRESFKFKINA